MAFKAGDILLKKYRLDTFLGLGGFSEVWKCHDLEAKQDLAVKIFLKQDQKGITLCGEEYAKMSKMRHPHILRPSFFTAQDGIPFLFMPYCEQGTALDQMGKLDERHIAKLILQIGSALEYIHNRPQPILHNDLKPDNFLIEETGDYLLTDFGISDQLNERLAREQDEERRTLVKAEEDRKGVTPKAYRAPELFKKKNSPELPPVKASDIWSFGASIYQLITGEPPFDKDGGGQQRVYYDVNPQTNINDIVESLPEGYSPVLEQLLLRCLAFHPWDRPGAQELVKAAALFLKEGVWEDKKEDLSEFYVSNTAIHFGNVPLHDKAVRTLDFTTANMSGRLNIQVGHPFSISLDGRNISSRLTVELRPEREQRPLYIHFSPLDPEKAKGAVTFDWKELQKQSIELSGQGQIQRRFPLWMKVAGGVVSIGAVALFAIPGEPEKSVPAIQPSPVIETTQQKSNAAPNTQPTLEQKPKQTTTSKPLDPTPVKANEPAITPTKPPKGKGKAKTSGDSLIDKLEREKAEQFKNN